MRQFRKAFFIVNNALTADVPKIKIYSQNLPINNAVSEFFK